MRCTPWSTRAGPPDGIVMRRRPPGRPGRASVAPSAAADETLKGVIAANDPARDKELVQIFHRRVLRLSMIIAGTDPNDENPLFYKLDPILG